MAGCATRPAHPRALQGLSLAGGLALAIAIGLGAWWFHVMRDELHPTLPLPDGDRLVEVELRNAASSAGEARVLHDFLNWRQHAHTIEAWARTAYSNAT